MTSQGAPRTGTEKTQLKIQQRGSGQGPGREGKVGEAAGQRERRSVLGEELGLRMPWGGGGGGPC